MTGLKVAAIGSVAGLGVTQAIPIDASELSRLGVAGLLAVVSVVAMRCTMKLYADKQSETTEHVSRLYGLIENSTKANEATAAAIKENTGVMVEVKDTIKTCRRKPE